MQFFTKEWYNLSQKTHFQLGLEEDKRAETFSEEFFQQVYRTKLNSWLETGREMAVLMNKPFNINKEMEEIHDKFSDNQEILKQVLPETILHQIADLRVFSLNIAARNIIETVTRYCEENERMVKEASKNYNKYLTEASPAMDQDIIKNFSFHDCTILKSIQNDNSLNIAPES